MTFQTGSDSFRGAAFIYDNLPDPRLVAREGVNDTALESLRALPGLLQEALVNQADEFFVTIARLLDRQDGDGVLATLRGARDAYANEQVEALADDAGIPINAAITRLRAAFA